MTFEELPTPIQKILERTRRRFEKEQKLWPAVHAAMPDGPIHDFIIRDFEVMDDAVRDRIEYKLIEGAHIGAKFVSTACEAWTLNLEGASQTFIDDAIELSKQHLIKTHDQKVEIVSVSVESFEMHYAISAPIRRLIHTRPRLGPWTTIAVTKENSWLPPGQEPSRFMFIYEKAYGGRIYR